MSWAQLLWYAWQQLLVAADVAVAGLQFPAQQAEFAVHAFALFVGSQQVSVLPQTFEPVQAPQALPPSPQSVPASPDWQLPLPSQQPVAQEVESQVQVPFKHSWPAGQALSHVPLQPSEAPLHFPVQLGAQHALS